MAFVYVLIDPRTEEIRYVGWTVCVKRREHEHCYKLDRKSHKTSWVRGLREVGLLPRLSLVSEVPDAEGPAAEVYWIGYFRALGCRLTNHTNGGEGTLGYRHTPETRARWSEKRRGRPHDWQKGRARLPQTLEKMSAATKRQMSDPAARESLRRLYQGQPLSEEHRDRIRTSLQGKPKSAEHRAKIAASLKGRARTPEHQAKLNEARRGKRSTDAETT